MHLHSENRCNDLLNYHTFLVFLPQKSVVISTFRKGYCYDITFFNSMGLCFLSHCQLISCAINCIHQLKQKRKKKEHFKKCYDLLSAVHSDGWPSKSFSEDSWFESADMSISLKFLFRLLDVFPKSLPREANSPAVSLKRKRNTHELCEH